VEEEEEEGEEGEVCVHRKRDEQRIRVARESSDDRAGKTRKSILRSVDRDSQLPF